VALLGVVLLVMLVVSIHWIRVISARYENTAAATVEDTAEDTAAGSPTTQDTATPSPSATEDGASEVGETRSGENADTTLLQVRRVAAPAGLEPSTGNEWLGIRAKTCVHADASPSGEVGWSSWQVVDDQDETFRGDDAQFDDFPAQQFESTRIQPGTCNLGWVLIAVPEGAFRSIESVVFRPNAPEPAQWAV
jgi:hypothetical protein